MVLISLWSRCSSRLKHNCCQLRLVAIIIDRCQGQSCEKFVNLVFCAVIIDILCDLHRATLPIWKLGPSTRLHFRRDSLGTTATFS